MTVDTWFTILSIFIAIAAILPRHELKLLMLNLTLFEKWLYSLLFLVYVPFLLFFKSLTVRFHFLDYFTMRNGFEPENIAFLIVYLLLGIVVTRIFILQPKGSPRATAIYLYDSIEDLSFRDFFLLFKRYSSHGKIVKEWTEYEKIIFHPRFLNGVIHEQHDFLTPYMVESEDFKKVFLVYLNDKCSPYYNELREHWNSYSLVDGSPFLSKIIVEDISKWLDSGVFQYFTEFFLQQIEKEMSQASIYNQVHRSSIQNEDAGWNLELNYHIQFIGILYATCIERNVDISTLSTRYNNRVTIFSYPMEWMIRNLIPTKDQVDEEYPTNYHWLIKEMFRIMSNWLRMFSEEANYRADSSYLRFITLAIGLCQSELYKGIEQQKIKPKFAVECIHYFSLSHYFSSGTQEALLDPIEQSIISDIPSELLELIIGFTLDQRFALTYNDLFTNNLQRENGNVRLVRFRNYLSENGMLVAPAER